MDRTDLLNRIYEARNRLEAAIAAWDAAEQSQPDLPNGWSIKDLLAHLGWWEQNGVEVYRALVEGREPYVPKSELIDATNDEVIASFRAKDLDEVKTYERKAFDDLVHIAAAAPEDELFNPHRWPWMQGRPLMDLIGWDTFHHYAEHFPDLEKSAVSRQTATGTD